MINSKSLLIGIIAGLIVSLAVITADRLTEVNAQTAMNSMNPAMNSMNPAMNSMNPAMNGMYGMPGMSGMGTMGMGTMGMGTMGMGTMGMGTMGMGSMYGGGGSQSRHGQFYAPGSIHQICHQDSMMAPAYCEPYYQVMSSIPGVKITNVEPVDNDTVEVTIKEIGSAKNGIDQASILFVGNSFMYGRADISGGWKGETIVIMDLTGMGTVYDYESMHVHIFATEQIPMDHSANQ